jgi:hypothetical protein
MASLTPRSRPTREVFRPQVEQVEARMQTIWVFFKAGGGLPGVWAVNNMLNIEIFFADK